MFLDYIITNNISPQEMINIIRGKSGMVSWLGTKDCKEMKKRVAAGDEKAKLVYNAMAYQAAKATGMLSVVVNGDVDAPLC